MRIWLLIAGVTASAGFAMALCADQLAAVISPSQFVPRSEVKVAAALLPHPELRKRSDAEKKTEQTAPDIAAIDTERKEVEPTRQEVPGIEVPKTDPPISSQPEVAALPKPEPEPVLSSPERLAWLKEILASEPPLPRRVKADKVVLHKGQRKLEIFRRGRKLKTYRVSLGFNPLGHKEQQGDGRTPEGRYVIDWRNPKSKYHLSLHVSYPNRKDKASARKRGVKPGGDIMIHGLPNHMGYLGPLHRFYDWTAGCIAMTNEEIREIWRAVPNGTPIEINP